MQRVSLTPLFRRAGHVPGCHHRRLEGAGPRIRDRIADLVTTLQSDATGTVKDFKVCKGIGVVVELSNGTTWFFDDEITA